MQDRQPTEDLAAIAAGPELAAALAPLTPASIPNDRMLKVLTAQYRQLCHEQARMAAVLTAVARCTGVPGPGAVARLADAVPDAFHETRAALRWTRRAAEYEHDLSEAVVHGMPELFEAWLAGKVDRPRVNVFDTYLSGLAAEHVEQICAKAVPRAPKLTTGQLAHLLRRMVIAVDPHAADRWYRRGLQERNVTAYPAPDGTITVSANGLPPDEAAAACERIQQIAAAARRAGHEGRIGQIRCDLFLGLLDGRFHGMTRDQVVAALVADFRRAQHADQKGTSHREGGGSRRGPGTTGAGRGDATGDGSVRRRDDGADDGPGKGSEEGPEEGPDGGPEDGPDDGPEDGPDDGPDDGPGDDCGGTDPRGPRPPGPSGGAVDQRVGIEIRVGLATLLELDDHPAEIPGVGLLLAPDARRRVALQGRAQWRFAVTDADGFLMSEGVTRERPSPVRRDGPPGGIVELHVSDTLLTALTCGTDLPGGWASLLADIAAQHSSRATSLVNLDAHPAERFPRAALRRHTEIRDRTCTFAGVCRHRAHTAHMDHCVEHAAGGPTVRANVGPLCLLDHTVKHRAGWTVTQPEPGLFVWRSPLGGEYATRGEFLLPEMPDPAPPKPAPEYRPPADLDDSPILRRRPPPPPRPEPPPPAAKSDPDEAPF